jgi:hypothetical protein
MSRRARVLLKARPTPAQLADRLVAPRVTSKNAPSSERIGPSTT